MSNTREIKGSKMKTGFTHESTHNESKEWYTPKYIFDSLKLRFDLDPCSPGADLVPWIPADKHLTIFEDGLTAPWEGLVFMNPPYGMDTPKWFKRLKEHGNGIGLVFARTDTGWFHDYVPFADAVLFIQGRVQFVSPDKAMEYHRGLYKPKGGCGSPSMLVAFGEKAYSSLVESDLGWVFHPAEVDVLSEIKPSVDGRVGERFASGKNDCAGRRPSDENENSPRNAETGQGNLFRG